jgi:hypothetical protein
LAEISTTHIPVIPSEPHWDSTHLSCKEYRHPSGNGRENTVFPVPEMCQNILGKKNENWKKKKEETGTDWSSVNSHRNN